MPGKPKEDPKKTQQQEIAEKKAPQTTAEPPKTAPTSPAPDDIRLKQEFDAVALWMALPRKERQPATQLELAKQLGISDNSITDWRKRDDFWELVDSHRQRWIKDDISDVVAGLIKKAKYGSAAEVKLFLQFAGVFTETSKVEHSGDGLRPTVIYLPDNARDPNTPQQPD